MLLYTYTFTLIQVYGWIRIIKFVLSFNQSFPKQDIYYLPLITVWIQWTLKIKSLSNENICSRLSHFVVIEKSNFVGTFYKLINFFINRQVICSGHWNKGNPFLCQQSVFYVTEYSCLSVLLKVELIFPNKLEVVFRSLYNCF